MAEQNGHVRRLFRELRTLDHLRDPIRLFGVQHWVRGDLVICHIEGTGITLFDSSIVKLDFAQNEQTSDEARVQADSHTYYLQSVHAFHLERDLRKARIKRLPIAVLKGVL